MVDATHAGSIFVLIKEYSTVGRQKFQQERIANYEIQF